MENNIFAFMVFWLKKRFYKRMPFTFTLPRKLFTYYEKAMCLIGTYNLLTLLIGTYDLLTRFLFIWLKFIKGKKTKYSAMK